MQDIVKQNGLADSDSEKGWYAIYTRYQHEKVVAGFLAGKGFETFLPLYSATHRWKDRNKVVSLPLYPSYVFLRGGLDRRLAVLTTPSVIGLVGFAGCVSFIPDAEIEAVRRVLESRLDVQPHPYLNCGDRVRMMSGPLEGVEGILIRKKNLYRLVLSVELLEKSVSVEVDASVVERVAPCHRHAVPSLSGSPSVAYC